MPFSEVIKPAFPLGSIVFILPVCLGSFENDKNPVGLHEFGVKSLKILKDVKVKQPRKVNKKVIDGLEKSIKSLSKN